MSVPEKLAFREIGLRRMPGFPRGGPVLHELSGGVNVVFGPQQSGKSSTVRAIQSLLWPSRAPEFASLVARLEIRGESWTAELDGGRTRWQREGADSSAPPLPPTEQRGRYRLALRELLLDENRSFAEAIARESAGGYDLAAAARAIGARAAAQRSGALQEAVVAAREKLKLARSVETEIREAESQLPELERRLADANAAAQRARLLEAALGHARSVAIEAELRLRLQALPPSLERLREDDHNRLTELVSKIDAETTAVRMARRTIEELDAQIGEIGWTEGLPAGVLDSLAEELRLAEERAREIEKLENDRAAAIARRSKAAEAFSGRVDTDRLSRVDVEQMRELGRLAARASELRNERLAAESLLRWLQAGPATADRDLLASAIDLLSEWLRAGDSRVSAARFQRRLALAATAALALLAFLLGVLVHPAFHAGILAAFALALLAVSRRETGAERDSIVRRFRALEVAEPASWTPDGVGARVHELERERVAAELEREKEHRRADAADRLRGTEAAQSEIDDEARAIAAKLGLPADQPIENLYWLVDRIRQWQENDDAVAGIDGSLEQTRAQCTDRLDGLARTIGQYDGSTVTNLSEARAAIAALRAKDERWRAARDRRKSAEESIRRSEVEIESAERARREIRERLRIEPAEEGLVEGWCAKLGTYRALAQQLAEAQAASKVALNALATNELFHEELRELSPDAVEAELLHCQEQAAGRDDLERTITATRTRVTDAQVRHDVEAALADVEEAELHLVQARDDDIGAVFASRLADYLRQATRDQSLPEVFHRARRWFGRITRGRCELDFDESGAASFRARDTVTDAGYSLDELSDGTRVQLLLAVRAAFVEVHESGLQLPLLLDETLATADEERAGAIIDSMVEMARAGRQIFYFTAQLDEAAKWRAALEREGIAHRIFDIREGRAPTSFPIPDRLRLDPVARVLPDPTGHDHLSYGRLLGIQAIDPRRDEVDGVHLWYVIDEPELLSRCLALGITHLGSLRSYLEHAGADAIRDVAERRDAIEARARGIAAYITAARIGHGKPVDRPAIEASGAISTVYMEDVVEISRAANGDARTVLAETEALTGFRKAKLKDFREFLMDQGYFDEREPLTSEDLHSRIVAAVSGDIQRGTLTSGDVNRLMRSLRGPGAREADAAEAEIARPGAETSA